MVEEEEVREPPAVAELRVSVCRSKNSEDPRRTVDVGKRRRHCELHLISD